MNPRSILDLPFEIMVKIFNKLPYNDVQSVRLTCYAFNDAGTYVQKTALHKLKRLAETCRMEAFLQISLLENPSTNNFHRYMRAMKGSLSVSYLAGIIRVADASTYYFGLDGSLPPVPCSLLTDLEKALSIATKRNPLVGRDRLKRIFTGSHKYLTTAMNSLHSPLKETSFFCSVVALLMCLRHTTCSIAQKPYGLRCDIYLNTPTTMLSINEYHLTAPLLIRFLTKLNLKGIEEFSGIRMGNLFAEENQTVDATIDHIELDIYCRPEQSVGVQYLEQLRGLEPTDFDVRFHGVTSVRQPSRRNSPIIHLDPWVRGTPLREGEQLATYTFASTLLS